VAYEPYGQDGPGAAGNSLPRHCVALATCACHGAATATGGRVLPGHIAVNWAVTGAGRHRLSDHRLRSCRLTSMKAQMMISSPYLAITTQHHGRRSVLRLQGELDLCSKDYLCRAITSALKRHPRILVVDLSALEFMDCSGLSVLVWAHKSLAAQQGRLLITGSTPIVRRLMHLTGVDTHLLLGSPQPLWRDSGTGTPEMRPRDLSARGSAGDLSLRYGQRGCSVPIPAGSWGPAPRQEGFHHEH
jgi:anti-anti-sigma factor